MFNVDWEATDTYEMVLSKAAFVRTLTQIESVKKVVYEYTDIANENSIVREELTNDSFSDMDNFIHMKSTTYICRTAQDRSWFRRP